jgi:ATP-dependent helicase/nuclease subunit A
VSASVTERVKRDAGKAMRGAGGRGAVWGTLVHRALELAAGEPDPGKIRTIVLDLLTAASVEDERITREDADELMELVERMRSSELWRRAEAGSRKLVEVPFSLSLPDDQFREAFGRGDGQAAQQTVHGVIDLVFETPEGWVVADYKSDTLGDDEETRLARVDLYREQVDLYAAAWERITGTTVCERVLYFTADHQAFSWERPSPEAAGSS